MMSEAAPARGRSGWLFVLTGIDGAGKSTALGRVRRLRPHWWTGGYDPEDWLASPDGLPLELAELRRSPGRHPRELVAELPAAERADFVSRMIRAHWRRRVEPRWAEGRVVLLDSYHFRFRVKLALQGAATGPLERCAAALPSPRTVFLLAVDPAEAARRKRSFDRQERLGEATLESFLEFQTRLAEGLIELCGRECDEVVEVDGSRPRQAVAERLVGEIESRLQRRGGEAGR